MAEHEPQQKREPTEEEKVVVRHRDELMKRLGKIDPGFVVAIIGRTPLPEADHFSDWHDHFKDNGHFTDSWGKAGDLVPEIDLSGLIGRVVGRQEQ